jgi:hypothetical protein
MKPTDSATLTAVAAPAVLAIGCAPDLVARCAQALGGIGVALRTCDFLNAATAVAERRPLALVLPDDLYAFDPEEFDALARDVRASLVRVEDEIVVAKLELLLTAAIDAAAARRGELLPAWPDDDLGLGHDGGPSEGPPTPPRAVLERDDRERGRRTAPHPALQAYVIGQRLPSRADLAAVAWPSLSDGPPSSRPGTA